MDGKTQTTIPCSMDYWSISKSTQRRIQLQSILLPPRTLPHPANNRSRGHQPRFPRNPRLTPMRFSITSPRSHSTPHSRTFQPCPDKIESYLHQKGIGSQICQEMKQGEINGEGLTDTIHIGRKDVGKEGNLMIAKSSPKDLK